MNRRVFLIFSVLLCLVVFFGCGDNDKPATPDSPQRPSVESLEIEPKTFAFENEETGSIFSIASNTVWNISCSEPWLTCSSVSGTGNRRSVTVSVAENISANVRTGVIFITTEGGIEKKVEVTQGGAEPFIIIEPLTAEVGGTFGAVIVTVTANTTWSALIPVDWIQLQSQTETHAILAIAENELTVEQSAEITFKLDDFDKSAKFNVKQQGYTVLLDKTGFVEGSLAGDNTTNSNGRDLSKMWDGRNINGATDIWVTNTALSPPIPMPQFFTIDLGVLAKLTHFVLFGRLDDVNTYAFNQEPRRYNVWGTDELLQPSGSPYYSDGSWKADWTLLGNCEVIKPSGNPLGNNTAEDIAAYRAGYRFDFDPEKPRVRYLRFEVIEVFSGALFIVAGEINIYGDNR